MAVRNRQSIEKMVAGSGAVGSTRRINGNARCALARRPEGPSIVRMAPYSPCDTNHLFQGLAVLDLRSNIEKWFRRRDDWTFVKSQDGRPNAPTRSQTRANG